MVDVTSIVVAVLALAGSVLASLFTGWAQFYSDDRKQKIEAEKLLRKYRDPLFWAANDLQSRLYNICEQNVLSLYWHEDFKDLVVVYTAYLIGQYLAWTHILRRQAQFVNFSHTRTTSEDVSRGRRSVYEVLFEISSIFLTDGGDLGVSPLQLWKGQQSAIGELMTIRDETSGDLICMGYAAFTHKWKYDEEFRTWFKPIEMDLHELAVKRTARHEPGERAVLRRYFAASQPTQESEIGVKESATVEGTVSQEVREDFRMPDSRSLSNVDYEGLLRDALRRAILLQHLLRELMEVLDSKGMHWDKTAILPIPLDYADARYCHCRTCIDRVKVHARTSRKEYATV